LFGEPHGCTKEKQKHVYSAAVQRRRAVSVPISQQADHGVIIEGAFKAPVLKVREKGPKALDADASKAWSYYLRYSHQSLVGNKDAERAIDSIDSLLKKENLKLTIGMLLDPIGKLAKAEQARISGSGAIARRWIAHEVEVGRIAAGQQGVGDRANTEARTIIDSLEVAWHLLAKFSGFVDGEINAQQISDDAFKLGHSLTVDDIPCISKVSSILLAKKDALSEYIGPEAHLLLELCLHANGKTKEQFRTDNYTKSLVPKIVDALRARTDNEEYLVPRSPRTIGKHENGRSSIPEFCQPQKEKEGELTPRKEVVPSTPSRETRNIPMLALSNHSPATSSVLSFSMSETMREMRDKPRPALRKVNTTLASRHP